MHLIADNFNEHSQTIALVSEQCTEDIMSIGNLMIKVLSQYGTIFWCGNPEVVQQIVSIWPRS